MPAKKELPDTLQRSSKKARRTWAKAHDNAVKEYGESRRSHQTAYAALKQKYEKVGDRWKRKDHNGPSDPGGRTRGGKTYGGVDVNGNTREELYKRASKLDISGRSKMNKKQLAAAIVKKQ